MFSRPKLSGDDNSADFFTIRDDRIRHKGYLAKVYMEWAETILNNCVSGGVTIEIGATNTTTQAVFRRVSAFGFDPIFLTTLAIQANAMHMPFASGSVKNLIATDTFHHLPDAEPFLAEVTRVLVDGGRLVLIEPWNNRWAKLVYQRFHPEPFLTDGDWTTIGDGPMTRANGALPWIVFKRDYERFVTQFPRLRVVRLEPLMPVSFLMSGGARSSLGFPRCFYGIVRLLERFAEHRGWGMSALIVVEKSNHSPSGDSTI